MRLGTFGVIAVTSALAFACTTTTTTSETTTEPSGSAPAKVENEDYRAKLSLSRPGHSTTIAALESKRGGGKPMTPWNGKAGGKCGLSSGDATCDACLDTSCCKENTACVNDADCTALIACGNACTDDTCIGNCLS